MHVCICTLTLHKDMMTCNYRTVSGLNMKISGRAPWARLRKRLPRVLRALCCLAGVWK